jgi:hypothetical protein
MHNQHGMSMKHSAWLIKVEQVITKQEILFYGTSSVFKYEGCKNDKVHS